MTNIIHLLILGLMNGATIALLAVGFCLIFSVLKIVDFSHTDRLTVAGYVFILLQPHVGLILSGIAAIALAAGLAVITNSLLVRPLLSRGRAVVMLGTLGLSIAIQSGIALFLGSRLRVSAIEEFPLPGPFPVYPREIGVFAFTLVVAFILHAILRRTKLGIRLRAMVNNYEIAVIMGVRARRIYNLVFLIAGALAGFGGCVLAVASGVFPTIGFRWLIYGFTAAVVGGLGSIWGAIAGGLAMGVVVSFTEAWGGALVAEAGMLTIMTVFLIFRPIGLLGKRLRSY